MFWSWANCLINDPIHLQICKSTARTRLLGHKSIHWVSWGHNTTYVLTSVSVSNVSLSKNFPIPVSFAALLSNATPPRDIILRVVVRRGWIMTDSDPRLLSARRIQWPYPNLISAALVGLTKQMSLIYKFPQVC